MSFKKVHVVVLLFLVIAGVNLFMQLRYLQGARQSLLGISSSTTPAMPSVGQEAVAPALVPVETTAAPLQTTSAMTFEAESECTHPEVAFVVPYYDESELALRKTLDSILAQERFLLPFVIVVSDDGGPKPERPQNVLAHMWRFGPPRQCISAVILRGANGRLPMARNRAFAWLPADVSWVINVDTGDKLDRRLIQLSFAALAQNPDVHVIHPQLCTVAGYHWNPPNLAVAPEPLYKKNALHCCPMFRKSLWERAGGYDASFVFGWEDWDFWVRANATERIIAVNLAENCLYTYDPGDLHRLCEREKDACQAAFTVAHGNLNGVTDTLRAHSVLLKSVEFLASKALQRQREEHPDFSLMSFWLGMLEEARGNLQDALQHYRLAAEQDTRAPSGLRRTRGVGWQSAVRGGDMLRTSGDVQRRSTWCQGMYRLLIDEAGLERTGPEWGAVGCDAQM